MKVRVVGGVVGMFEIPLSGSYEEAIGRESEPALRRCGTVRIISLYTAGDRAVPYLISTSVWKAGALPPPSELLGVLYVGIAGLALASTNTIARKIVGIAMMLVGLALAQVRRGIVQGRRTTPRRRQQPK